MESAPFEGIIATHRGLLRRLLPSDAAGELAVREGQYHHVVTGTARVVCFARTGAAARRLPRRAAVLHALARLDLGFRTPRPLAVGGAPGTREPPYLVMSRVPGSPLGKDALDEPRAWEAVARQYAALLARLAAAGEAGTVRAALGEAGADSWRTFAADVRTELFPLMSAGGRERAERELAPLDGLSRSGRALVHGDLGSENVLWETVEGRPRLSGVVDWDEAVIGDPAEDWAALAASHGERLLSRVRELCGPAGSRAAGRVPVIRATFALQQALSARRDGDAGALADGLGGYR